MVEAFNKTLEIALIKVCNVQQHDWDQGIPTILWAYKTTQKRLIGHTPFRLVYGKEVVMPMEFIIHSLRVASITNFMEENIVQKHLQELMDLEEDRFIAQQKAREGAIESLA